MTRGNNDASSACLRVDNNYRGILSHLRARNLRPDTLVLTPQWLHSSYNVSTSLSVCGTSGLVEL